MPRKKPQDKPSDVLGGARKHISVTRAIGNVMDRVDGHTRDIADLVTIVSVVQQRITDWETKIYSVAGRPPVKLEKCKVWLIEYLKRGPTHVNRVMRDGCNRAGFNEALIRKAARRIEVLTVNRAWALPDNEYVKQAIAREKARKRREA